MQTVTNNFCIRHDSTAVMACAKFYSDLTVKNRIAAKKHFYKIRIVHENHWVRCVPGHKPTARHI